MVTKDLNELLRNSRREIEIYDSEFTPLYDLDSYIKELAAPTINQGLLVPDEYDPIDYSKDAFTDFMIKRNEVNADTLNGRAIKLNELVDMFEEASQYIQAKLLVEDPDLEKDSPNIFKQAIAILNDPYKKEKYKLSRASYKDKLDKGYSAQLDAVNKLKDSMLALQEEYRKNAAEYLESAESWRNKHKITDYYTNKSETGEFDLTDIDTYLYKTPGLMGSSASSMLSLATAMVAGYVSAAAAATAAAAITAGTGGFGAPLAVAAAGAITSIGANLYSREEETYAEIFQHYKDKVRIQAEKKKALQPTLATARKELKLKGVDVDALNDDLVLNSVLNNEVLTGNDTFNKIKVDAVEGLDDVYKLNMALSTSDIALTAITVMPFGALLNSAKAIAKPIGKAVNKAEDLYKATKNMIGKPKKLAEQLELRIQLVASFGLDKAKHVLNTKSTAKYIKEVGGKVLLTAAMEGSEEGAQYMVGKDYVNDKYTKNPWDIPSWARVVGKLIRSVYAAITPFDSIYSTDAEFMENFKGGALLGGLMTGAMIGGAETFSKIKTGKTQLGQLLDANEFVAKLYTDKIVEQDLFDKNLKYAAAVRNSSKANIDNAFDALKGFNIEGLSAEDIDAEKRRSNRVMALAESINNKNLATRNGIDPRTEDYDIFVALQEHHRAKFKEAADVKTKADDEVYVKLTELLYARYEADTDELLIKRNSLHRILKKKALAKISKSVKEQIAALKETAKKMDISTSVESLAKVQVELKKLEEIEAGLKSENDSFSMMEDRAESQIATGVKYNMLVWNSEELARKNAAKEWLDNTVDGDELTKIAELEDAIEQDIYASIDKEISAQLYREMTHPTTYNIQDTLELIRRFRTDSIRSRRNLLKKKPKFLDYITTTAKRRVEEYKAKVELEEKETQNLQDLARNIHQETTEKGTEITPIPTTNVKPPVDIPVADDKKGTAKTEATIESTVPVTAAPVDLKAPVKTHALAVAEAEAKLKELRNGEAEAAKPYIEINKKAAEDLYVVAAETTLQRIVEEAILPQGPTFTSIDSFTNEPHEVPVIGYDSVHLKVRGTKDLYTYQYKGYRVSIDISNYLDAYMDTPNVVNKYAQIYADLEEAKELLYNSIQVGDKDLVYKYQVLVYDNINKFEAEVAADKLKAAKAAEEAAAKLSKPTEGIDLVLPASTTLSIEEKKAALKAAAKAKREAKKAEKAAAKAAADAKQGELFTEDKSEPKEEAKTETVPPTKDEVKTEATEPVGTEETDDATVVEDTIPEDTKEDVKTPVDGVLSSSEGLSTQTDTNVSTEDKVTENVLDELIYDKNEDPYSHLINYWVNRQTNEKFQGYDEFESSDEFSKVSTQPDFLEKATVEFTVRDYVDKKGVITKAIYAEFTYKGKHYVAAVSDPVALRNYLSRYKSLTTTDLIINNLLALRSKILELASRLKPGLKIVPTVVDRTTGRITNLRNEDNSPKRRNLTETGLVDKDVMNITPDTTTIGISTGPRGNLIIRCGNMVYSGNGTTMGLAYLIHNGKPIQLMPRTFKEDGDVVDVIIQMLIANPTVNYVTKEGVETPMYPLQLLNILVNFGSQTESYREDKRLDPKLAEALAKKRFYIDLNKLYLGDKIYAMSDVISNQAVLAEIKEYIMNNLHWNIDEEAFINLYIGGISVRTSDVFSGIKTYFELYKQDKLVIIPGKLEFTMAEAGLKREGNKIVRDEEHPRGLSMMGWYISNNVLVTDFGGYLDANLYVADVKVVDSAEEKTVAEASAKIEKALLENKAESTTSETTTEESVEEPKPKTKPKRNRKDQPDLFDAFRDLGPLKAIETPIDDNVIAIDAARAWLKEQLGLDDDAIDILDNVIDVLKSGLVVVGRTKLDAIQLSKLAPIGTHYHEAWHRVSNLLISARKRNLIYDKFRKKHHTKADDKAIDEMMADLFMLFLLDEAPNIDFKVTSWFRKINNFIKVWSKVNSFNLAKMYYNLNTGKYSKSKASAENIARFKAMYLNAGPNFTMNGYDFKTIHNTSLYNSIIDGLMYVFFLFNGVLDYSDIDMLGEQGVDFVDNLKYAVETQSIKNPENEVLKEIYEQFDSTFLPILAQKLKKLGLYISERQYNEEMSEKDSDGKDINIGLHTLASYEISKRETASAEVKFFFRSIPSYVYSNKDGDVVKQVDTDPSTGFPKFVDPRKAWNTVLYDLHDITGIDNMKARVDKYAETSLFYAAVSRKLLNLIDLSHSDNKSVATKAEVLLTKLETTIKSHMHKFVTGKVTRGADGLISIAIKDNNIDTKAFMYPKIWSASLLYDMSGSLIFDLEADGSIKLTNSGKETLQKFVINLATIKRAFLSGGKLKTDAAGTTYDLMVEANLNRLKRLLASMLNSVGIGIDVETIDSLLRSGQFGDYNKLTQYQLLNNLVMNTNVYGGILSVANTIDDILNLVKFSKSNDVTVITSITKDHDVIKTKPVDLWSNKGFVKTLASEYASVHANLDELRSLGAAGTNLYNMAQNNFITDLVDRLNKDSAYVRKLMSVVFNGSSMILDLIRSGAKIGVETFVNFKDDTAFDIGRDFLEITEREDYISKMAMIFSDKLIFPTMADKKTYQILSGLKLNHEHVKYTSSNGKHFANYGDATVSQFLRYFDSEVEAIELCMRLLDDTVDENGNHNKDWVEPSKRITNYHTGKDPNGLHFRLITGIYYNANGKENFIDFNNPNKTALLNLKAAKMWLSDPSISAETRKSFVSSTLSKTVAGEVQKAIELGLITANLRNDTYSLLNVLLDNVELNKRKAYYQGSEDATIRQNAEGYAIYDMIADYTTNTITSIVEVEKVFSGDPAYYSWKRSEDGIIDMAVDKLKRLGGLISTGLNNRLDFGSYFHRDTYNVAELKDYQARDSLYEILLKSFLEGNVYDFVKVYHGSSAILDEDGNYIPVLLLIDNPKYKVAVSMARVQTDKEVKSYDALADITDASVYVSPNMYRDLMRVLGFWSDEIEEAYKILTDESTNDLWLTSPELYKKVLATSLKPLKYSAFGLRLSEIPGLGIPYYNKMALFPLFKNMATGDIKPLYDRMTDPNNPLDMVMFLTAVKTGSVGAIPYYKNALNLQLDLTVLSAELMDELLAKDVNYEGNVVNNMYDLHVYSQDFENLRQQLATDAHLKEIRMTGTLMLKVALSNMRHEELYGIDDKVKGKDLYEEVFSIMNALSQQGASRITQELYSKDGTVNKSALYNRLRTSLLEEDANDNIVSGLVLDDDGLPKVPLAACSDSGLIESNFIAGVNKETIDVNIPGGAFILRCSFGIDASSQSVVSDKMLNHGEKLKLLDDDGSMHSIVSINLFSHIIPNYNNKTFAEARTWLLNHHIIGVDSEPNAIGYRIPTQSVASVSALKFVDVLPSIMGDTIILPDAFTALTGSDFDIDKLYVSRYQYDRNGKKVNLDDKITDYVLLNEAALTNQLINLYLKVLTTKEHGNELKVSIDIATKDLKDVLKQIEGNVAKLPATPFRIYSPSFLEETKLNYSKGKSSIGPMALNNAHHILTLMLNPLFESNAFTEGLDLINTNKIFDDTDGETKGGRILDWLSALINASVDVAKDPYLSRLNVNAYTYNMITYLIRMGKGKNSFKFLCLPILKEIAEEVNKAGGKFGMDTFKSQSLLLKDALDKVLDRYDKGRKILNKLQKLSEKEVVEMFADIFSSRRKLLNNLDEVSRYHKQRSEIAEEQMKMYFLWTLLKPYADSLADLVKFSKVDTKKIGKTFIEQRDFRFGMNNFANKSKFAPGLVYRFFADSFIETKTHNSIDLCSDIFRNELYRTSSGFYEYYNHIMEVLNKTNMAGTKLANSTANAIEAQIKSDFFNELMLKRNLSTRNMLYGRRSMAKRLLTLKHLILEGRYKDLIDSQGNIVNEFLQFLLPNINSTDNALIPDFIDTSNLFTLDKVEADNMINYWRDLLEHLSPEIRLFAEDLIYYAFITSGDNSNANSFFNYVPNSWRIESGYVEYTRNKLNDMLGRNSISYLSFSDFFLNNWWNDDIVKPYQETVDIETDDFSILKSAFFTIDKYSDQLERSVPVMIFGQRTNSAASSNNIKPVGYTLVFRLDSVINVPVFPPFIKMKFGKSDTTNNILMYLLVGLKTTSTRSGKSEYAPIYSVVTKKGLRHKGHVVVEYGRNGQLPFNESFDFNGELLVEEGNIALYIENDSSISAELKRVLQTQFSRIFSSRRFYNDDTIPELLTEDDFVDELFITEASSPYNRDDVEKNRYSMYIFTDNTDRTSGGKHSESSWYTEKYGTAGYGSSRNPTTAVIRGLPNAYPISTMKYFYKNHPGMTVAKARWTDADIKEFSSVIDAELLLIYDEFVSNTKYLDIVIPNSDFLFNSKISNITQARTPLLYDYLNNAYLEFESKIAESLKQHEDQQEVADIGTLSLKMDEPATIDVVETLEDTKAQSMDEFIDEWSAKEGWTKEYFIANVLPKIEDAYQVEFKLAPDQNVKPDFKGSMTFYYDGKSNDNITVDNTLDAIIEGLRTATTRYKAMDYWSNVKVGDIIQWTRGDGKSVKVIVTREFRNLNDALTKVAPTTNESTTQIVSKVGSVNVYAGTNSNSNLSNFAIRPFSVKVTFGDVVRPIKFLSVEQAFHYMKAKMFGKYDLMNLIITTTNGATLKSYTNSRNLVLSAALLAQWNLVSTDILKRLMKLSFLLNSEATAALLATGDATITHLSSYGTEMDNGRFSTLLMAVRKELATNTHSDSYGESYGLHSGGAVGADSIFGLLGSIFGIKVNHYWHGLKTPTGNSQITEEQFEEGKLHVLLANKTLNRRPDKYMDLLARNWMQVANADAIFAVSNLTGDRTGATGGTGWAVQMAIDANKPVYLFDLGSSTWTLFKNGKFVQIDEPVLTKDFAGIGSREINDAGIKAIISLYKHAFIDSEIKSDAEVKEDVNNTSTTANDPVNFNGAELSKEVLESNNTILTNAELIKLRPYTGTANPRIAVASERTDPVFFSKQIIDILNGDASVEDKFRSNKYSGKDFAALYLITKHDGLPLKDLLNYKIPKIIHFSITGLGGSKYEPGVMKPMDLLDRIAQFVEQGLDPDMVTVRIDPIVPGVTTNEVIEQIVKRASEIGIKNIRFSVMDLYSTTRKFMTELGYDYSKYYTGTAMHANKDVITEIYEFMSQLSLKYAVQMSTCAEPFGFANISKEACLSVSAINNMLGTSIPESATGKLRELCSCYGGKTDLLSYNNKCASSCVYCYAHHNMDKLLNYYNADGTLKDNPFTRTGSNQKVKEVKLDGTQQLVDLLVPEGIRDLFTFDAKTLSNMGLYSKYDKMIAEELAPLELTEEELEPTLRDFHEILNSIDSLELTEERAEEEFRKFVCNL